MAWFRRIAIALLGRYGARLRFPHLLLLAGAFFGLDLIIPDVIPFLDEILLGLATLLFATWKSDKADKADKANKAGAADGSDLAARSTD